jgi:hypothetical protein
MKKRLIWVLLLSICMVFFCGCSQINPINNTTSTLPSTTLNETVQWMEYQGRFYTKDLERAQKEIPFNILLPTYLPNMKQNTYLPDIDGPLCQSQMDGVTVNIIYKLNPGHGNPEILIIHESDNSMSLGELEVNPDLEQVEIQGISVVKTKDNWSPDTDVYFSFNSQSIFYIVETHYVSNEESYKIVESMIRQLK